MLVHHHAAKIEKRPAGGKAWIRHLFFLLLLLAGSAVARTGGDVPPMHARSMAMAAAGCALEGNGLLNPALVEGMPRELGVTWLPSRFGMTELGGGTAHGVFPFAGVTTAAAVAYSGYEHWRELQLSLSCAVTAGEHLRLGLRGNAFAVVLSHYGTLTAFSADAAVQVQVAPALACAAVAEHVLQLPFADGERLPVLLRMGLAWESGGLRLVADLEKEARYPVAFRYGGEYEVVSGLLLRVGAGSVPSTASAGVALRWGAWECSYACSAHPDLGWTHLAGIGFQP